MKNLKKLGNIFGSVNYLLYTCTIIKNKQIWSY